MGCTDTRKIALVVEYEGTRYHGFQVQANVATVQGEIERALMRLTGESIRISGASRTDQGVHATGQVVSFRSASRLTPDVFLRALNHHLPADIAVWQAFWLADDFDVRRAAISREYRYSILNRATLSPLLRRSACFVPKPLDVGAMNRACQALLGTHDFVAFASALDGAKNTVRTVHRAEVARENELVAFYMTANSFLPHQVRNTIGALVKVGLGKSDASAFQEVLRCSRPGVAGPAFPPHGLCLTKVNYPEGIG